MAVYTLKDAIERAGSLDSDAVVTALEKTDLMGGVYGRIRFNPKTTRSFQRDPNEALWEQSSSAKREGLWFSAQNRMGEVKLPPG